jgi:hypothetical protein
LQYTEHFLLWQSLQLAARYSGFHNIYTKKLCHLLLKPEGKENYWVRGHMHLFAVAMYDE